MLNPYIYVYARLLNLDGPMNITLDLHSEALIENWR